MKKELEDKLKELETRLDMKVNYRIESSCCREPDNVFAYRTEIKGDILVETVPNSYEFVKSGILSVIFFDFQQALEDDVDIDELFDGHSIDISDYTSQIIDHKGGGINDELFSSIDGSDENCFRNVLIISHVCLNKHGRGNGFGTKVLKDIEDVFGKNCIIVMKPYPLQFSKHDFNFPEMDFDGIPKKGIKSLTNKLCKIYEKIGYKKLKGTDLVVKLK